MIVDRLQIIPLEEPQRGKDLLLWRNERCVGQDWFVQFAPLLADGVVMVYPLMLVVRYVVGILKDNLTKKI